MERLRSLFHHVPCSMMFLSDHPYVALTPGQTKPRRENPVAVSAGEVAARGRGAFRAFLGPRNEESRKRGKSQKSQHLEHCRDRSQWDTDGHSHGINMSLYATPAFPHIEGSYFIQAKKCNGIGLTHMHESTTIAKPRSSCGC